MVKKRGLGKSLDALLAYTGSEAISSVETSHATGETLCQLPIDQLRRGKYQPRRHFDPVQLQELADSIKTTGGLLQPIVVRPLSFGRKL